jgi:hypothetical protein
MAMLSSLARLEGLALDLVSNWLAAPRCRSSRRQSKTPAVVKARVDRRTVPANPARAASRLLNSNLKALKQIRSE